MDKGNGRLQQKKPLLNKVAGVIKTFVKDYKCFIHPWKKYKPSGNPDDNRLIIENDYETVKIILEEL